MNDSISLKIVQRNKRHMLYDFLRKPSGYSNLPGKESSLNTALESSAH